MIIDEILETSLLHPDLNTAGYWTNNDAQVEVMRSPSRQFLGYLITRETDGMELCLVTYASKAFARCRATGATMYREIDWRMCRDVTAHFSNREGGDKIGEGTAKTTRRASH